MSETRTVHFKIAPALNAYLLWLERTGRQFDLAQFDLFAANYQDAQQQQQASALPGRGEGQ